jgi:hypothetical protein
MAKLIIKYQSKRISIEEALRWIRLKMAIDILNSDLTIIYTYYWLITN